MNDQNERRGRATPIAASGSEHADGPAAPGRDSRAPGLHLIGDLHGCRTGAARMTDAGALESFCRQAVADAGLTIVGSLFHSFGAGQGVTGAVVLAESHLAIHTWPEDALVTLDVYVCNYRGDSSARAEALFGALQQAFAPADACVHRVWRR